MENEANNTQTKSNYILEGTEQQEHGHDAQKRTRETARTNRTGTIHEEKDIAQKGQFKEERARTITTNGASEKRTRKGPKHGQGT